MAVGAGLDTILRPVSEAAVVPAGGCYSVVSVRRSVVGAAVFGTGGAIPGAIVRVSGAGATVPGAGAVPLSAELRHLAREFLDAPQRLGVDYWLASADERRWGDGLGDAVCTEGRGVQLNLELVGKSSSYVGGEGGVADWSRCCAESSPARPRRGCWNWDGLRSPISSSLRSCRARCSLDGDSQFSSFV